MDKRETGNIGENLAVRFLEERGYNILDRNYLKKWGEIDIVALRQAQDKQSKNDVLHFIEVKALRIRSGQAQIYMPEANVRAWKKLRLSRAIRTYLLDHKIPDEQDFQIDVIAIFLDFERKKAKIRFIRNVILE